MTLLVVGLSHRSAGMALLERAALVGPGIHLLEAALCRGEHVAGAMVLSTCNRLEVYADVTRFHGGLNEIGEALAVASGLPLADLADHLYAHYEQAAVEHAFTVSSGLDSMAVGESQIQGQVRAALRAARESATAGQAVGRLMDQALRVGRRVHTETGLDRAGASLVTFGLEQVEAHRGTPLSGAHVLVLGAGAMSGLAVSTLRRAGVANLAIASRTAARASRLAEGAGAVALPMAGVAQALAAADVVVTCAGGGDVLVTAGMAREAAAARGGRAQVYLDLALPRDVDPAVADLDGASLIDLEALGRLLDGRDDLDLAQARAIVAEEVAAFWATAQGDQVAPVVVALREHARAVMDAELQRLDARLRALPDLPEDLGPRVRTELAQAVHRVVDKLLHTPTVRVKELAATPGGGSYADALSRLFDLDPEAGSAGGALRPSEEVAR